MSETSLAIITKAERMLAEAVTIQDFKEIKDMALTFADFARRKKLGDEAVRRGESYATRAEIEMGKRLRETERAKGGQPHQKKPTGNIVVPVEPTLAELGITKRESSRAQALAELSKAKQQIAVEDRKQKIILIREHQKKKNAEERDSCTIIGGTYRVIYADPPWCYSDKCETGSIQGGGAERHYSSMSIRRLCDLVDAKGRHVRDIAAKNAVLFLWVTSPLLAECFAVIEAWGFAYKASFVWDKVRHNMGHYNSVRHELLLLAIRGSCQPDENLQHDSVISIERTKKHSEKPEEFRAIIDAMYHRPKRTVDRIELFARKKVEGWDVFGDDIASA